MRKPNGYWTKEKCQEEALKYNTRNNYRINSNSSYLSARIHDWLDIVCSYDKK